MKEKILETLKAMGFIVEEEDEQASCFEYEGHWFLHIYNKNDENFLNITLPAVLDKEGMDELEFYKILDKVNNTVKYVKAYDNYGKAWLCYERELLGDEDLEKLLESMIYHLEAALHFFHRIQKNHDDGSSLEDGLDEEDGDGGDDEEGKDGGNGDQEDCLTETD